MANADPQGRQPQGRQSQGAELFVGIDVSKDYLDVALRPWGGPPQASFRVPNDAAGFATLIARLRQTPPTVTVAEATGGLEQPMAAALALAGLPVSLINPRAARDFARSSGRLAKTYALDAAILAPPKTLGKLIGLRRVPCPMRRRRN